MKTSNNNEFSHLNEKGFPSMVDVGSKLITERKAKATGRITLPDSIFSQLSLGNDQVKKGSILQTAVIAGTQAVKRCFELIPFCHPLPVDSIKFQHCLEQNALRIDCEVKAVYKTGVEMEALTGVSVALLTVYDMCKSAGQNMEIQDIKVIEKFGGKKDIGLGS